MMVAFWAVVMLALVWAVRTTTSPGQRPEGSALRILDGGRRRVLERAIDES